MINKDRKAAFFSLNFKAAHTNRLKGNETHPAIPATILENAPETLAKGLKTGEIYSTRKEEFHITEFEVNEKYILILFNFTSDRYSDPAYYDKEKDIRSTVQRSESERMEFSCHAMIKRSAPFGTSEMIVEKVSGLPKAKLATLINQVFTRLKRESPEIFEFNHPDGSKDDSGKARKCKFRMSAVIDGVPSDQMQRDIESGTISGLELVSREKHTAWDNNGHFTEKKSIIKMDFTAPPGSRMDSLKLFLNSIQKNRKEIERAKLRFTPPGQTAGFESANFDLLESDPTDCEYFNKTASLDYHADHTSYDGFVDDIVKSMKRHLRIQ